ncbi:ribonuclease HI [Coleofasciculus sp. F4-SAH-05]|jgi:ribonuclease HI|uniref:ribonuclease HI n=1 Tax=Coleofasciculus TaxID=669368 RepID=UPI0032FBA207
MPVTRQIKSVYTDGACSGNPGPGGWGTVVYFTDGSVHEIGGATAKTTNNRMELLAAIEALILVQGSGQTQPITLYTDSEYVRNGITKWIKGWKKKGWKTSQGKAVLNQDLWEKLDAVNSPLVTWQYVRGHSGNQGNERCDQIANAFANGKSPTLTQVLEEVNHSTSPTLPQKTPVTGVSDEKTTFDVVYKDVPSSLPTSETPMIEIPDSPNNSNDELPREIRVAQLGNLIETLRIADEIASEGYLISSSELADLMDINASAVTSRGDHWPWRNWIVSRVRREGNQILWQLERVDQVKSGDEE